MCCPSVRFSCALCLVDSKKDVRALAATNKYMHTAKDSEIILGNLFLMVKDPETISVIMFSYDRGS